MLSYLLARLQSGKKRISIDRTTKPMQTTPSLPSPSHQNRHTMQDRLDCQFVGPQEYCKLLVSNKQLERSDEHMLGIRGVFDLKTGVRFLIHEEDLLRALDKS